MTVYSYRTRFLKQFGSVFLVCTLMMLGACSSSTGESTSTKDGGSSSGVPPVPPVPPAPPAPPKPTENTIESVYEIKCQSCHLEQGLHFSGRSFTRSSLEEKIEYMITERADGECGNEQSVPECAQSLAQYIFSEGRFNVTEIDEIFTPSPTPIPKLAKTALSRLTQQEYQNTIQRAFPDLVFPNVLLPADFTGIVFTHNAYGELGDFTAYADAALVLGGVVANDLVDRCDWVNEVESCINGWLRAPLEILYRRSIEAEDIVKLTALFGTLRSGFSADLGETEQLSVVVSRILLSPDFLYRMEKGPGKVDEGQEISEHALAARLSYLITSSPPDAELSQVADAGELTQADNLLRQAERLLDTPAGEDMIWSFVFQWLDIDRIESGVPVNLKKSMLEETRALVREILFEDAGPLVDLFTANHSWWDDVLADHYGYYNSAGGVTAELSRIDLSDIPERLGILTHASVLSALSLGNPNSNVIARGNMVYSRLMCGKVPTASAELRLIAVSNRLEDERCASCHQLMDPIGQGFNGYEELGQLREGIYTGSLLGTDVDGEFSSILELSEKISESDRFLQCAGSMLFDFSMGREPSQKDQPSLDAMQAALKQSGSFRDLFLALVTSEAFRTRYDEPEVEACKLE